MVQPSAAGPKLQVKRAQRGGQRNGVVVKVLAGEVSLSYVYLIAAICAEVVATSALKASNEFTNIGPSIVVIVGYGAAFYLLALVLRTIPLGIAYALWSGLGIVLVTIAGAVFYKQALDLPAFIGMGLIIVGAVVINLFSRTVN